MQYYASGYASATTRILLFTVPSSAPNLYYVCYNHLGMGGAINTNSTLGSSNFDGSTQSRVKAKCNSRILYCYLYRSAERNTHHRSWVRSKPQVLYQKVEMQHTLNTIGMFIIHKLTPNYFVFLNERTASGNGLGDYYIDGTFSSTVFAVGDDIYGPNVRNNNYVRIVLVK